MAARVAISFVAPPGGHRIPPPHGRILSSRRAPDNGTLRSVDDMQETPPAPGRPPRFGRFLAIAVAAFFLMVILGVVWVWRRAEREERWRQRDAEFFVPVRTNAQPR